MPVETMAKWMDDHFFGASIQRTLKRPLNGFSVFDHMRHRFQTLSTAIDPLGRSIIQLLNFQIKSPRWDLWHPGRI